MPRTFGHCKHTQHALPKHTGLPHKRRLRAAASPPQRGGPAGRPALWERQRRGKGIRAARQTCRAAKAGMGIFQNSRCRTVYNPGLLASTRSEARARMCTVWVSFFCNASRRNRAGTGTSKDQERGAALLKHSVPVLVKHRPRASSLKSALLRPVTASLSQGSNNILMFVAQKKNKHKGANSFTR